MRRVQSTRLRWVALLLAVTALGGCGAHGDAGSRAPIHRYVAMGDSYTAGSGIPTVDTTNGCQRSDHGYPVLLAARIHATLVDVACGGAATAQVTEPQAGITPVPPPMIDAVTADTDLVTVSLGLNDNFYFDPIAVCPQLTAGHPTGTPCTDWEKAQGDSSLWGRVPAIEQRLVGVLTLVKQKAPDARVLMVGVPQLVPAHGSCAAYPIDAGDYPYFHEAFVRLADAMRDAAKAAGATYVDVLGPSAGHDVCAGQDAWLNGSVTTDQAIFYHPFAVEQAAVAGLIEQALDLGD